MIEPLLTKFVFDAQSTGLDGLRRISYVSGGGVQPLPLQVCVTTANCVVGETCVAVTEFASVRVNVAPLALAMCQVPLLTGEPVMRSVSLAATPNPLSVQLRPSVRTIWSPPPERR